MEFHPALYRDGRPAHHRGRRHDADLREQFDHNLKVLALVSEVNQDAARIKEAQSKLTAAGDAANLDQINQLAADLITPSIRYSKPALQTHITYLYSMTNSTDQKIGRYAVERYVTLEKELDRRTAELRSILGPQFTYLGDVDFPGNVTVTVGDDDDEQ
jgi:hypothetical protein